ncbi:hypothetical protein H7Y29_01970 [Microbacteriaceae bacterium]|nr:hypothetical protein [Candidatus Saccharibacteria bacterium]
MTTVRTTLDRLVSTMGLALAVLLLAAGGVLVWASNYVGDQVGSQLSMQDITMPSAGALQKLPKEDAAALKEFAGQKMTTGGQAKAFSDHYILVHMNAASGNRTYEEVSSEFVTMSDEAKASPEGQKLGQLRQTLFMGSTLRGLLLNAYAFGTMGAVALVAGIGAFIGAVFMLLLSALGFRHARSAITVG